MTPTNSRLRRAATFMTPLALMLAAAAPISPALAQDVTCAAAPAKPAGAEKPKRGLRLGGLLSAVREAAVVADFLPEGRGGDTVRALQSAASVASAVTERNPGAAVQILAEQTDTSPAAQAAAQAAAGKLAEFATRAPRGCAPTEQSSPVAP